MPIVIGAKRESDFTDPIGMLGDCHRRIEMFLNVLVRVAEQVHGDALNEEQRGALETALQYFREAAPKHTADEEESLFPRLRRIEDAGVRTFLARIESLEEEHVCADRSAHQRCRVAVARYRLHCCTPAGGEQQNRRGSVCRPAGASRL